MGEESTLSTDTTFNRELEPGVISNEMLTKAIMEQGHKGEAGRLAQLSQLQLETVTVIRLEFQNILKIDHLWVMKNLEVLSLSFNKIDKIENLSRLPKLKELNLSFNYIEKMENLDKLENLRILSLYGNRISRIENIDNLERLVIFSAGRNNIKTLEGLERLRFLKELRSLNLAENPIAQDTSKPLRLYLATLLPQLKYYEYILVRPNERDAGKDIFQRELIDILEHERIEIIERTNAAKERDDEVRLSKSFVEHLNGHQLFDSLFEGDSEGEALLSIGSEAMDLKDDYRNEAYVFTQSIYKMGLEQQEKRQAEIELYSRCITDERKKAQLMGQKIISNFLQSFNNLHVLAKEIVVGLRGRDLNSKTYNAETEKLLDELNLCKSGFNSLFEDTWHTLMGIEMQLFERTEEGNSTFENTIKEMTNEFIELAQAQFVLLREAEINFSDALVDTVQQFVTFKAAAGQADKLPEVLKESLDDKDVISNMAAGMRDQHMQLIDSREDKLITRSRNWVKELCDDLQNSEIIRNRAKVLEITYFLDQHRQTFMSAVDEVASKLEV
ncbi:dynein regulatory complex subunit 3-like [Anopheles ziemanni]|uniref:dynein regulatory complex subunit 3-like n=1 Tax=Anopheles coustani TaxID=139045 RepID=UPI00265A773C|nr:dynein regulatory complex subunit 3-like [Anopheles coustani]XP_058166571.1 dynein regulatory complex subunit 3-like [Anopheles ziemanni]